MNKTFLFTLLILASVLLAEEDAYHQALRQQLQTEFGITGGTWVLPETEKQTNASASLSNVTRKLIANTGAEPFAEILELKTTARRPNSWDNVVRFPTTQAVKKGDALLAVIWMNSIESDVQYNTLTHKFELANDPWTQSLHQSGNIRSGWRQWLLPFEASVDYPAGASGSRYQLDMGYMKGTVQIAGVAIINFGKAYKKERLPFSTHHMDYDGREDGAPWRAAALARIEEVRKGDLTVKVVNKLGQPIKNAEVKTEMLRHEFGFGTALSMGQWLSKTRDGQTYRDKLLDLDGRGHGFNIIVFENALKWGPWESETSEGTKAQVVECIDRLRAENIRVRGHSLVWPGTSWLPSRINNNLNNLPYLRNEIRSRIFDTAGHPGVQGSIDEWDVINEMIHNKTLENAFGTQDIYKEWLEWAHEADPDALLYLNEYNIISSGGQNPGSQSAYKALLRKLLDQGAPLHGLGMQGHMGSNLTPPERVLQVFDDFAELGLRISITEYDAAGAAPEIAADYMRDILIAAFSHPDMHNFLMWGFWDGAHWLNDAPLFKRDWTLKPSGEVFIDWVFNKWWSNSSGKTDAQGIYSTRAFYGDYEIAVQVDGVETYAAPSFNRQTGEMVVQVDTEATEVSGRAEPTGFQLAPAYPNPFNAATTLSYRLPADEHVRLAVYDLSGKQVRTLVDERQKAGSHDVRFHAEDLPSGVYFFRLTTSNLTRDGKLTLVR